MNNEEKILQMLAEMRSGLAEMKAEQVEMRSGLAEMKAEQAEMRSGLAEMKAEQAEMRSGLAEMKSELAEMRSEQAEMKDLLQKVAVTQEAVVLPRLDLLAEGHTHLVETLAEKSRVEKLEEEVDFIKTVIKTLSKDVAELKKAQ